MKTKGYAIWLISKSSTSKKLAALIKKLSNKNSSPIFEPHITLLGYIIGSEDQVVKKTKILAASIPQLNIKLSNISFTGNFIKCLFLDADKEKELTNANKLARKIFNMESRDNYLPHLSLMYGYFPKNLKKQIIKEGRLQNLRVNFKISRVHLYKTDGEVKDWKKIREFDLN